MAAIAHGSGRELYDIDLYVSKLELSKITDFGKEYLTFGPARYKDECWDIEGAQFVIGGVKVELTTDNDCRFYSPIKNSWVTQPIDFNSTVRKFVYGREVNIMCFQQLITYKKLLAREVDLDDVKRLLS